MHSKISLFKIEIIWPFKSRNMLVLAGTILEGEIAKGMKIKMSERDIPIQHIEFMLIRSQAKELPSICLEYQSEDELQELSKLFHEEMIISIIL